MYSAFKGAQVERQLQIPAPLQESALEEAANSHHQVHRRVPIVARALLDEFTADHIRPLRFTCVHRADSEILLDTNGDICVMETR
jgi:hypothetical protein